MFKAIFAVVSSFLKLPQGLPELPPGDHEHVEVRHAAPAFMSYRLVALFIPNAIWFGSTVFGLTAAAVKEPGVMVGLIPITVVLAGVLAFGFVLIRLDYELRTYLITDRSLRVREGAFIVRELTLSYVNVQNVTLEQGPLERLFGFSNVVVETAGGGGAAEETGASTGHRAVLRGLTDAEVVRDLIRARLMAVHKTAGLGDADEAHHPGDGLDAAQLVAVRDAARALAEALEKRGRPA
jgi:membrane protein YdbS with pleckstrin-like domain